MADRCTRASSNFSQRLVGPTLVVWNHASLSHSTCTSLAIFGHSLLGRQEPRLIEIQHCHFSAWKSVVSIQSDEASRGWSELMRSAHLPANPYGRRRGFSTLESLIYDTPVVSCYLSQTTIEDNSTHLVLPKASLNTTAHHDDPR